MPQTLEVVTGFGERLTEAGIHFDVRLGRSDSVMFTVVVPGERWEVEFLVSGDVDVEVFTSGGIITDAAKLEELFERFTD